MLSRTFLYILAKNAAASGTLPDWFSRPIGRSESLLYLKLVCSFSSKATAVKCLVGYKLKLSFPFSVVPRHLEEWTSFFLRKF